MPVEDPMMLKTALGEDLLFKSMNATEELGRLFEFSIDALADSGTIKPEDLLGQPASVSVVLPEGDKRYFHGLVCAMGTEGSLDDMFAYRMVLRPWLWLLTRRTDTRVFQDMTVQDILKKVFEPFSPDYDFQITGTLPKFEYCVQYRETDFNFVSRLMEQEGIYYYFSHQADKHTMVIVNSSSAHKPNPVQDSFEYRVAADEQHDFEPITQWRAHKEIQTGQVVLRDFDFTAPKVFPEAKAKAPRKDASVKLEVYDYPGVFSKSADGDRYSQLRMEELQARFSRVDGGGAVRGDSGDFLTEGHDIGLGLGEFTAGIGDERFGGAQAGLGRGAGIGGVTGQPALLSQLGLAPGEELAEFVLDALIGRDGGGRCLPFQGKDPAKQEADGRSEEQADSEIRTSGHRQDSKGWKEKAEEGSGPGMGGNPPRPAGGCSKMGNIEQPTFNTEHRREYQARAFARRWRTAAKCRSPTKSIHASRENQTDADCKTVSHARRQKDSPAVDRRPSTAYRCSVGHEHQNAEDDSDEIVSSNHMEHYGVWAQQFHRQVIPMPSKAEHGGGHKKTAPNQEP